MTLIEIGVSLVTVLLTILFVVGTAHYLTEQELQSATSIHKEPFDGGGWRFDPRDLERGRWYILDKDTTPDGTGTVYTYFRSVNDRQWQILVRWRKTQTETPKATNASESHQ